MQQSFCEARERNGNGLKVILTQNCFGGLVHRMHMPLSAVAVQQSHGEGWHRDGAKWLEMAVPPGNFSAAHWGKPHASLLLTARLSTVSDELCLCVRC